MRKNKEPFIRLEFRIPRIARGYWFRRGSGEEVEEDQIDGQAISFIVAVVS